MPAALWIEQIRGLAAMQCHIHQQLAQCRTEFEAVPGKPASHHHCGPVRVAADDKMSIWGVGVEADPGVLHLYRMNGGDEVQR